MSFSSSRGELELQVANGQTGCAKEKGNGNENETCIKTIMQTTAVVTLLHHSSSSGTLYHLQKNTKTAKTQNSQQERKHRRLLKRLTAKLNHGFKKNRSRTVPAKFKCKKLLRLLMALKNHSRPEQKNMQNTLC
jgi:hypothetical protein